MYRTVLKRNGDKRLQRKFTRFCRCCLNKRKFYQKGLPIPKSQKNICFFFFVVVSQTVVEVNGVAIRGACFCSGHASTCSFSGDQFVCDCQRRTTGASCQDCQAGTTAVQLSENFNGCQSKFANRISMSIREKSREWETEKREKRGEENEKWKKSESSKSPWNKPRGIHGLETNDTGSPSRSQSPESLALIAAPPHYPESINRKKSPWTEHGTTAQSGRRCCIFYIPDTVQISSKEKKKK